MTDDAVKLVINPMESAPTDGTTVLLKFKNDLSEFKFENNWRNMLFVGRHHGGLMGWGFAAPIGCGGFPDECFAGWYSLEGL